MQILIHLYDQEVIQEDAILRWDDEKKDADESDKVYVKQSEKFIQVSIIISVLELVVDYLIYVVPLRDNIV